MRGGTVSDREVVPCHNEIGCQPLRDLFETKTYKQAQMSDLNSAAVEFCEQAFRKFQELEVSNSADEPDLCFDGVPSARYKRGLRLSDLDRMESPDVDRMHSYSRQSKASHTNSDPS